MELNVHVKWNEPQHMAAVNPPEQDREEVADVLLCAYAYAGEAGYDAHDELDIKMAANRLRTTEYFAGKTARKEKLGYPQSTGLIPKTYARLRIKHAEGKCCSLA